MRLDSAGALMPVGAVAGDAQVEVDEKIAASHAANSELPDFGGHF